jgi:O-antigen/teichoic acid export membrane protein
MVKSGTRAGSLASNVLVLSSGTFAIQLLSAVGQLALALWLDAAQFGYWAAATAGLIVVSAFVNLGEVNGYLARPAARLSASTQRTRRINLVLTLAGLVIATTYYAAGRESVAVLMAIAALNLPLMGEDGLLYAHYVRAGRRRDVVAAQTLGALCRLAVGIAVAWATGSAIAFALSMFAASLLTVARLRLGLRRDPTRLLVAEMEPAMPIRARLPWAAQSFSQTVARQADYLVVSFVSTPQLLGIYWFSYQATVGISGVIASPLSKSALSELARADRTERPMLARHLVGYVAGGAGIVCAAIAGAVLMMKDLLPDGWAAAGPVVVLLLGSLPARLLAPIVDALQMAGGRWWSSTSYGAMDALGTAVAALAAMTGDVRLLASAIVVWKVTLAIVRHLAVLRPETFAGRLSLPMFMTAFAAAMLAAGLDPERYGAFGVSTAVLVSGLALASTHYGAARKDVRS